MRTGLIGPDETKCIVNSNIQLFTKSLFSLYRYKLDTDNIIKKK